MVQPSILMLISTRHGLLLLWVLPGKAIWGICFQQQAVQGYLETVRQSQAMSFACGPRCKTLCSAFCEHVGGDTIQSVHDCVRVPPPGPPRPPHTFSLYIPSSLPPSPQCILMRT